MAKSSKSKPPLTLAEHQALGAELHAMHNRLSQIAHDLGLRYATRVVTPAMAAVRGVDGVRAALDSVLWHEQRGTADRATLDRTYYPGGADGMKLADVPPVDAAVKREAAIPTQPPVTQANKP